MRGELHFAENVFRAAVANGGADIALNAPLSPPPENGVYLHGEISGAEDAGAWAALGGGAAKTGISLHITDSNLFNIYHPTLVVQSFPPETGPRKIALRGGGISGTVFYGGNILRAELSRLSLRAAGGGGLDIRNLTISAAVADFHFGGAALGGAEIYGAPADGGWILQKAVFQNGANALRLSAKYDGAETSLTMSLSAPDAPGLLAALGQGDVISEGGAELSGYLSWPKTPVDFSAAAAVGGASLRAQDLRYPDAGPGVLGFLAVFSPQSLLQLGFTEIGKEGILLNTMSGGISFSGGAAQFENFTMENDDINISLGGAANLETRTLKLSGRVRPGHRLLKAGSAVSIGAGLAAVQPLSLAAGWFLGKIFEKPLSEIGAYNYTITGPWESPVYAETGVTFRAPPTPAP